MTLGNGMGRAIAVGRSVNDLIDEARSLGYDGIDFEPVGRDYRATSYNAKGQRAQAMGRDEVHAAQSLVRVLKRR